MNSPFRERRTHPLVWVLLGGAGVCMLPLACCSGIFLVGLFAPRVPQRAGDQQPSGGLVGAGEQATLKKSFLADNEQALEELMRVCRNNDTDGLGRMFLGGRAFAVEDGTKATVLEPGIMSYRVRVLDGPCAGREGLIATEFVGR